MTWALRSLCWPSRRAHLLTTRKWWWHCLRQSCALRGRYAGRPFPAQYGQASRRHRRLVHRAELHRCTGGLGAISPQQAAPGIYRGIACYNGDTPKTGEDDRPMQRPTPKLQWEGTGLTAHCLSYPRSFWQTVSQPSHCGVRFAQVEKRTTPHTRVTKQAESVVGSGGRRLKPFLIRETFK